MTALETGKKSAEKFILNNASFTEEQFSAAGMASAIARYHAERSISDFIKGWLSVVGEALSGAWTNLAEAALWGAIAKRADEDDVDNAIELAYIRANAKQETVIVFRTANGLFARTPAEMARYNLNDSPIIIRTVVPAPTDDETVNNPFQGSDKYDEIPEPEDEETLVMEAAKHNMDFLTHDELDERAETDPEARSFYEEKYGKWEPNDYGQEAGKLLVAGTMYAPEDVTVRNFPELPETVCVRFLHDDSSMFVTHGEDGYNALKALADAADVEAARVKLHSGETLTDAEPDVLYDAPEPGEDDSAAARTGRKIIAAAKPGETVVYLNTHKFIRKAEYVGEEHSNEAGTWLRTSDGLTFIPYDQIIGVEKAPADLPAPTPDNQGLLAEFEAATQVLKPGNAGTNIPAAALHVPGAILLNPIGLEARRADIARRRAELEAEEARLNAEQALADIVAALNPSNEFYLSSFTVKCKLCSTPVMLSFGPGTTPGYIAKRLRDATTADCDECAHNRETFGEEQEDDGSIGGADEYGARGPFNLDGLRADEIEGLDDEGLDTLTAAQELEDFADDGDRPPFLDYFNEQPF